MSIKQFTQLNTYNKVFLILANTLLNSQVWSYNRMREVKCLSGSIDCIFFNQKVKNSISESSLMSNTLFKVGLGLQFNFLSVHWEKWCHAHHASSAFIIPPSSCRADTWNYLFLIGKFFMGLEPAGFWCQTHWVYWWLCWINPFPATSQVFCACFLW